MIIEKGIIQPSFGNKKNGIRLFTRANIIRAGVLTSKGAAVHKSGGIVYEWELVRPRSINISETKIRYIDEDIIFFSIPQNHFGHALVGTMAFAHILLNEKYKNHKIVFIDEEPCETIKILLRYLGVKDENIIVVKEYTQFKSVVVVKQAFRTLFLPPKYIKYVPYGINKEFIDTFNLIAQKFRCANSLNPQKIYFSRSKLLGNTILGEEKIEQVFKNNGYEIFYPEQFPLEEQIKLVANADFFACVQGSLEHHSLFMKDGATLIAMSRNEKQTGRQPLINKLQKTIKHINLRTDVRFGKHAPYMIGATKDLLEFFDKNRFVYNADDLKPTYQEFKNCIDICFIDKKQRALKYIFKNLVKQHKDFWKRIK